jgi:hypothetical protein
MKKNLFLFLTLLFVLPFVWAVDIPYVIKQENSVSQIQSELQSLINGVTENDRVVVTGSKTNADITLSLNITTGKTVVWQAVYESTATFLALHLIFFTGGGNFEVAEGAQISSVAEEQVSSYSDDATIIVTGGSIMAKSGNALVIVGKNPRIIISGGYMCNDADDRFPVVVADNPYGIEALVLVNGTSVIEAKNLGSAIVTGGTVMVGGNAQVRSNIGGDKFATTIRCSHIEVYENAKITAQNECAIMGYQSVLVRNNAVVEAKNNAIAIYIYTEGGIIEKGHVEMSDNAQVIAAHNYAISHNVKDLTLRIFGGVVFAYGKEMLDVINDPTFTGPYSAGTILAWDKEIGNTNYDIQSTDDIFKMPESASAYWDIKEGKHGISYEYSYCRGFIPLDVDVQLSVKEINTSGISVYPNPTTGELKVKLVSSEARKLEQLRITDIEIFDVFGKKMSSKFKIQNSELVFDISHLPPGIYFLRMGSEVVKVVKQ